MAARPQLLRGGAVLGGDGWREPCDVRLEGDRIAAVAPQLSDDGCDVLAVAGLLVVPGFVDLHLHGAGGAMFEDADAAAVRRIIETLPRFGTTALLATIGALAPEVLPRAVEVAAGALRSSSGARVLGLHLEGPFLNPARAGAQRPDWMRAPSFEEFDHLQRCASGAIRLVTLAPELPNALEVIVALRRRGVHVALGHSQASAEQVEAAIAAGATHVTHLFNAMGSLHHRAPGLPGVALTADELAVELIADGVHVDRRIVDLTWRCKPRERVLLVSDGVAAVGEADGPRTLFGAACLVSDAVRRADTGQLAGSRITLGDAVRNVARWCPRLPPADILHAASRWPASSLGLDERAGALAVGAPADLALLDHELGLRAVICRGEGLNPG